MIGPLPLGSVTATRGGDFFHQRQIRTWLWDQTINFVLAGDVAAIGAADIDPASGQARLSSRRAAELFDEHTGGWTLHQLRHSALTHAAEAGANTSTLLAYSGHTSVTSLARYARVSPEALGRWQQRRDPTRRR